MNIFNNIFTWNFTIHFTIKDQITKQQTGVVCHHPKNTFILYIYCII